jgi:hypothetical protein
MTFFDQTIFAIWRLECKILFYFSMRRMIFCWLFVCTSIICISWINISKILDIAYIDEATFFINELLIVNRFLIFFERVINFTLSLNKRFVVITFFFIFSARCKRSISFLTKSNRRLFFSLYFFILKINVFSFIIFFSCLCWLMLLYDAIIVVVVASISRWAFVFIATTYEIKVMMIFAMLRSMLFNLLFIFFSVNDICCFTINVDNKTSTRWRKNNDVETSISSINLLRSKLLISLMRCFLSFFKENSFKVDRIFVKTSRRLMSDDITSIRVENLYVFKR